MKPVSIDEKDDVVHLVYIKENVPIFAYKDGKLSGMIVNERKDTGFDAWILRLGGCIGATGKHKTRALCIKSCIKHGYTFYIEE